MNCSDCENYKPKFYNITRICKEDILSMYEGKELTKAKQVVKKMSKDDMEYLASKLSDDYLTQLYWSSLRIIFETYYLNGELGEE